MLWRNRRASSNIVDRRGMGGVGIGTVLIGAVVYALMGGNPLEYLAYKSGDIQMQQSKTGTDEEKQFVSVVLADTEDVWNEIFAANNMRYQEPKLVLFSHSVSSACGRASSAVGPFYCPADQQVYLDLAFLNQLSNKLGASGDFAQAYVIAHEVGHHVQTILGVRQERSTVPMELQADCFAGVWAYQTQRAKSVLEQGDLEEAINAASVVGDDTLQKKSGQEVMPDSFTHGSSAQRVAAFKAGFREGNAKTCLEQFKSGASKSAGW